MKRFTSFLIVLLVPFLLMAAPLKNVPVKLTLPNGVTLNCFASGDEFFNYLHDADGYSIVKGSDGYYYYASHAEGDTLIPSGYKVGKTDPKLITTLAPGVLISGSTYDRLRKESPYQMPKRSTVSKTLGEVNVSSTYLIGNTKYLVYFIQLADGEPFDQTYSQVNTLFNSTTSASIKGYYIANSYNKFSYTAHMIPSGNPNGSIRCYEDPMTRTYINTGENPPVPESNWGLTRFHSLLRRTVYWADANCPLPDGLIVDKDNDGRVDDVVFVVSGSAVSGTAFWPHAS